MIATHIPKLLNAKLKQTPLCARIVGNIPRSLICSKSINMRRELWAAPLNAAKIKEGRETVAALPQNFSFEPVLPDILDAQIKQILLPIDNDHYVSTTPLPSMGVLHEVYHRLKGLPFLERTIQPTGAAIPNHGEGLMMQGGVIRMLRRGLSEKERSEWHGRFVQLVAKCENMNISGGMIAVGFPAITAIGGMVHALERQTGLKIDFALGMRNTNWKLGVPKLIISKHATGTTTGRVHGKTAHPLPGFSTEEVNGNCEIVLLLRSEGSLKVISKALEQITRIAGASLFEPKISIKYNSKPEKASFLIDASSAVIELITNSEATDSLDAALKMYVKDGYWRNKKWHQYRPDYTLNQTGYALLETPTNRINTRMQKYPHAWSEPVFSLIRQDCMRNEAWWTRKSNDAGVFWEGGKS